MKRILKIIGRSANRDIWFADLHSIYEGSFATVLEASLLLADCIQPESANEFAHNPDGTYYRGVVGQIAKNNCTSYAILLKS